MKLTSPEFIPRCSCYCVYHAAVVVPTTELKQKSYRNIRQKS